MEEIDKLNLQSFYPASLRITAIRQTATQITIEMKSRKHHHRCDECLQEMTAYHGTYVRAVQDLPILGKKVTLRIRSYEYNCLSCNLSQDGLTHHILT